MGTFEKTGELALACPRSHESVSSTAKLPKRRVRGATVQGPAKTQLSIWALALVVAVAAIWSAFGNLGLLGWDPHYYYSVMEDKTWAEIYPFEQAMFWIVGVFRPSSFAAYEFIVIAVSLSVLLFAFYRLGYSRFDQFVLVLFFCCSFYGLHFVLTFQRQFFGLVLFLFSISGRKYSILARIGSLFSQLFTFTLHIFWELRRLSARTTAAVVLLSLPVAMSLAGSLLNDKADHYGDYGVDNPSHLLLKQALTVGFCLVVLFTLKKGEGALRSLTTAYIALSLPVVFWPFYAGVFARLDYFFLPLIVALWPRYVREDRRALCRVSIIGFTVIGFALWMNLNAECVVMGDCPQP